MPLSPARAKRAEAKWKDELFWDACERIDVDLTRGRRVLVGDRFPPSLRDRLIETYENLGWTITYVPPGRSYNDPTYTFEEKP
jgi:hypothetical protein